MLRVTGLLLRNLEITTRGIHSKQCLFNPTGELEFVVASLLGPSDKVPTFIPEWLENIEVELPYYRYIYIYIESS